MNRRNPTLILITFLVGFSAVEVAGIVGGNFYNIGQYGYNVLIRYMGRTNCGGALVSSQHVVTAAHCVKDMSIALIMVLGGMDYAEGVWSEIGERRRVAKMWVHPRYSIQTFDSDIAVLKLKSPMRGKNIRTIRLPTKPLKPTQIATITGWGYMYENGYNAMRLRATHVKMWAYKKCKQSYKNELRPSMFCANNPGKDSCTGDDGGPLVRRGVLYGVVSWGRGCGRPRYPGIYANVYNLRRFVKPLLKQ